MDLKQFDSSDVRKNFGTYTILGLALFAMVFFGICNPESFVQQLDNVAGSVDGEEITQSDFTRAYANERSRQGGDSRIAGQVLEQLINARMLFLVAKQLSLTVTDDEVFALLGEVKFFKGKDGKFSDEIFHNYLRENRYSESTFMEEVRRNLTVQRLQDLVTGASYVSNASVDYDYRLSESKMSVDYIKVDPEKIQITVSDQEIAKFLSDKESEKKIKEYYDGHESLYHVPEKVRARHILVSYKDARNASEEASKRSKEEAKKKAEGILAQVKASGADFAAIASKETDDPSGKNKGGDLGLFAKNAMVKEFADAVFALKAGQISDSVVETAFGFHIIQNLEIKPAVDMNLEQAKTGIAQTLLRTNKVQTIAKETATNILKAIKEGKAIDDMLKSIQSEWKTTESFALNVNFIPGLGNNAKLIESVLGLREPMQLLNEPVEVQKVFFIFRLRSRTVADAAAQDAKARESRAMSLNYRLGYIFFQKLEQTTRESLEKRKAIFRNPQYLALDTQKEE